MKYRIKEEKRANGDSTYMPQMNDGINWVDMSTLSCNTRGDAKDVINFYTGHEIVKTEYEYF